MPTSRKKIIITGATGFLGAHLVRHLSGLGHHILALGRQPKPPDALLQWAEYQCVDMSRPLPAFEADMVVHAAALASDSARYSDLFLANVTATEHLLAATQAVPKWLLVSSSSVYPYANGQPQTEADAGTHAHLLTDYGKTKWLSEQALTAHPNTDQCRLVLRPRAIYGVGDRVILPRLLGMVKGGTFTRPGPMRNHTAQTNVRLLAEVAERYLMQPWAAGRTTTLNVADAQPYLMGSTMHTFLESLYERPLAVREVPLWLLHMVAATRLSKRVTPLLLNAVTNNCTLDLGQFHAHFPPSGAAFDMASETALIKAWLTRLGGIESYLKVCESAPWRVGEE